MICNRKDHIMEAQKQLNDLEIYKDENFDKDLIPNLTPASNML